MIWSGCGGLLAASSRNESGPLDDEDAAKIGNNDGAVLCRAFSCLALAFLITLVVSSRKITSTWARYPGHCLRAFRHCVHPLGSASHCGSIVSEYDYSWMCHAEETVVAFETH